MAKKKKAEESGYHRTLMELIMLREHDYDAFMHKLYEALSGEFRGMVHDASPIEEKIKALDSMIRYFEELEQYEKCAELQRMAKELKPE
jgi:hypothetical protein